MNLSRHGNRPKPALVHHTELLWTPDHRRQSRLKNCCFCLSDWLIYLLATFSILLGGIVFIAFAAGKLPLQYLLRQLPLHLAASIHKGHPLQH